MEALRCKRRREWDTGAWEELEFNEEEALGTCDTASGEADVEWGENVVKEAVKCENDGNGDHEVKCEGSGVKMDGGGTVGEEIGGRHTAEPKRKPLRGKRRGKKSIRKEGEERLANTMARWLGTCPYKDKAD